LSETHAVRPSEMIAPTVLLTGAQGFTGRYMAAALEAAGYHVHGWGNATAPDMTQVDLTDRLAVGEAVARLQPDFVVHLAAIAFVAHGDAAAIYNVNVVGTRNLLEALAQLPSPPKKVLLASSANVYGEREGAIDETAPYRPQNDYAVSKAAMEMMASLWQSRLPIVMVRPFNYTGVGQADNFLLPKIVAHFRKGAPVIELGNVDVWRDFYDVRQVVKLYTQLLAKADPGTVFNVCSGREVAIRDIISQLEKISGREIEIRTNPQFVRANEIRHLRGDRSRIEALLGELPAFDIGDTLRWMYEA
jgi:GDP-6-deoxy-D-talose 4-dehydrogenase